jgi:hypothetical protein
MGTGYVIERHAHEYGHGHDQRLDRTFTLPAGHRITGSWNTVLTVSGQTVTAKNVSHNGTLGTRGQRHVRVPGEPAQRQHAVAERIHLHLALNGTGGPAA